MKAGDLVQVKPAKSGVFLVIREILNGDKDYPLFSRTGNSLWLLFGEDIGCAPMNEEWIEVINES